MEQRNPPGRHRTDDLLLFKQALLPSELPGEVKEREGFEPSTEVSLFLLSRKVL